VPVLFLFFWVTLNGRITVEIVVLGVFISIMMSLFTYRILGISPKNELTVWKNYFTFFIPYVAVLVVSIIKANFLMIRLILSPQGNVSPQIIYFNSPVKTGFSRILLTYSIMLTPGTFIFELEEGCFGVHAIQKDMTVDIDKTNIVQKLQKIEEKIDA